jgi:hypothetical protein
MGTFKNDFLQDIEASLFTEETFGEIVVCLIPSAPSLNLKAIVNKSSFNIDTELEGYGKGIEVTFLSKELPISVKKNDEFSINGEIYRVEDVLSRTHFFTRILLRKPHGKRL